MKAPLIHPRLSLAAALLALPLLLPACAGQDAGGTGGAAADGTAAVDRPIRIVGSSTVYPFAAKVAEQFGRGTGFATPVIESTGSGGGIKLFCAGPGLDTPDLTNSSRAIKQSELDSCAAHGVEGVTEIKIGYDGIVVAHARSTPPLDLSRRQLFLALARQVPQGEGEGKLVDNPYRTWRDVDPALPAVDIEVLGPPPTSGTRDAFLELVMEAGCSEWEWIAALRDSDQDRFQQICHTIREDGGYVEAGENDNLIVQKLEANPDALGIFGYSFLDQNRDRLQGSRIDGVEPSFENIASQLYPVSRPLFVYVKDSHVGQVPGIAELVQELTSPQAIGEDGYLPEIGLIPLPADELAQVRQRTAALTAAGDAAAAATASGE
ncbi:MAG TPA: PstS family phosphate ABC transporter substrate-binding protein [Thermoanaerobaculia bacterium]|nr:PstS family phosphate ABC transporter substrate-binding protein [Thermoanaerobaculia bacterium]